MLDTHRTERLNSIIVLGVVGAVLMTIGAVGSGGILVSDPLIGSGPLSWIRYGHGRVLALTLVYVGFALLVLAWIVLGRRVLAGTVTARQVLRAAMCWIAPLLLSPPLFTRDVWAYLAQGALLYGHDPYTSVPNVLTTIPHILANVYPSWLSTPSPYGPLFLAVAKGIVTITGDSPLAGVIVTRIVFLPALALMVWALRRLVRELGGSEAVAMWLAVASPMTVVHLIGGPHNDVLMLGLLVSGVLAAVRRQHELAVVVLTLAMLTKPTAAVALPFVVWIWANRLPGNRIQAFLRAGASSVGIFAVVFALGTWAALGRFELGWIGGLSGPLQIQNWLNLPTGAGQLAHAFWSLVEDTPDDPFITVARIIGAVVLAGVAARQWWLAREGGNRAVWHMGVTLLAVAILAPPTLPWYLTWGFVILSGFNWPRRQLSWVVGVAVFLTLAFYPTGEQGLTHPFYMVIVFAVSGLAGYAMHSERPLWSGLRGGRARRRPVA